MGLAERIGSATRLTPAEARLARQIALAPERAASSTLTQLAAWTGSSTSTAQRLCRKLGYRGYRELRADAASTMPAVEEDSAPVDVNFPFGAGDGADTVVRNICSVYAGTLADTASLIDRDELERAARLIDRANGVEIYTGSHNLYAGMLFADRLLSAGTRAVCPAGDESRLRLALQSDRRRVAVLITYSALAPIYRRLTVELRRRETPIVLVGSRRAQRRIPEASACLLVSERESLQNRITQFSSHVAIQFALDALFACVFARNYERDMAFLRLSLPYTTINLHTGR